MTTLTPDRLLLRPPRPDDADAIAGHSSDFGVAGNVEFRRDEEGVAEIGYFLGRILWGTGLLTEALTAALSRFFAAPTDDRRFRAPSVSTPPPLPSSANSALSRPGARCCIAWRAARISSTSTPNSPAPPFRP
jgi:hypothetical protein